MTKVIYCWKCGNKIHSSLIGQIECQHCKANTTDAEKFLESNRLNNLTRRVYNLEHIADLISKIITCKENK